MSDYWYKNAVVYAVDVGRFMDANGDGIGDFEGLIGRLNYISRLGVDCLWLLPFYPTPNRDNGYDVEDHYGVDPRHGTLGDFVEFVREAEARGIDVIVDLVVNHTSDQHPWFQQARSDSNSKYRDYYIWSDEPVEPEPGKGNIFPGQEEGVWTYDEVAEAYYYHRFYDFEPGLDMTNPDVREEVRKIMGFWLELGVSGFRVDAASHMIERKGLESTEPDEPHDILREMRSFVTKRRGDAVLLAEADVQPSGLDEYFGGEEGDEMNLLFNFVLDNYLFLALARKRSEPLVQGLRLLPMIPKEGQWANFLRNLDELDLERLTESQREDVYEAFAPDEDMRIYGRGIRRRLAPMLGDDQARIELAFSLLFTLPGTPIFVYGDEIGMGEDLSLRGRSAVRTPMQWADEPNAGFSTAPTDELVAPVIDEGPFGYEHVNVDDQRFDPDSLLSWMERTIRTRKETPAFGWGELTIVETENPAVFAHRCDWEGTTLVAVHNLADAECSVTLDFDPNWTDDEPKLIDLLADTQYEPIERGTWEVALEGYGYRWFRLGGVRQTPHNQ